jgi:hypothetical protein
MATISTSRTDIVSQTAIAFMRASTVNFTISNAKPNTKLYAFFDGVPVDKYITQTGGTKGVNVVTNSSGTQTGVFDIPGFTFSTGTKTLKFQDAPSFDQNSIPGSTVSSAENTYTSNGTLVVSQTTNTTTNNIVNTTTIINNIIGALNDPLAQSFFTHGIAGGVYVTSIDIFFQSKEPNGGIPVTLEIRELVAGYPALTLASLYSRVTKNPQDVLVSNTALVPTTFEFEVPIYLPENRDWCFVLTSNSNAYNVWTAKIGEKSKETGVTIFEQPFVGSMFKSENNITWSIDATEDMKFVIRKANFSPAGSSINLAARANKLYLLGSNLTVTSGTAVVTIKFDHLHGLRSGDKIHIYAPVNSTFRGVTTAQLTGVFDATYLTDYSVRVTLPAGSFTSTGDLNLPGIVNEIQVDAGGSGYTGTPTVDIIGTCTTPATATVHTSGGVITSVTMDSHGSGYTAAPTIQLNGTGSGAILTLLSESVFLVVTNRVYDEVLPRIANFAVPQTSVSASFKNTSKDYAVQSSNIVNLNLNAPVNTRSILVSNENKDAFLPGQTPTELVLNLSTGLANVSPVISLSELPTLECRAYLINNQTANETITPATTTGSSTLSDVVVTAGGTGYTSTVINISAPDLVGGVQATAHAVLTSTAVTDVIIDNPGSGYTSMPSVLMAGTYTTTAVLTPVMTPFNTELLATGGSARSRYITKQITLSTVSTGVTITANAYSNVHTSFDFYFRSTLKSDSKNHVSQPWVMMNCDTERNLSTQLGKYIDYTFYLNNLSPFDVYDIKIVLRSTLNNEIPRVKNYRAVILAT